MYQTNKPKAHPYNVIKFKKTKGEKVMAWVGIVDGIILYVEWFETPVKCDVYLEKVLKNSIWPAVKAV